MKFKLVANNGEKTFVLVFDKGDEVVSTLKRFADDNKLSASHINGIGAFSDVTLGYFDRDTKKYIENPVDQQCELLSLIGDIAEAPGGKPQPHMHVVVGLRDSTTRGGHLLKAHVFPTLEMTLVEAPAELHKKIDPDVQIALINL
jgi:hypothetical protein